MQGPGFRRGSRRATPASGGNQPGPGADLEQEDTMIRMLLSAGTILALTIGLAQAAGDPAAGKAKAAGCVGCHGANGQGVPPNPALAGKSEDQLLQALQEYKSGKRTNAVMKALAAGLSDQDMANLASYFASLK
jgi:cytochrome c553